MAKIDIDFDKSKFKDYYDDLLKTHTNVFQRMEHLASNQKVTNVKSFVKNIRTQASSDISEREIVRKKKIDEMVKTKVGIKGAILSDWRSGKISESDAKKQIAELNKQLASAKKIINEESKTDQHQLSVLKDIAKLLEARISNENSDSNISRDNKLSSSSRSKHEEIVEKRTKDYKKQFEADKKKQEREERVKLKNDMIWQRRHNAEKRREREKEKKDLEKSEKGKKEGKIRHNYQAYRDKIDSQNQSADTRRDLKKAGFMGMGFGAGASTMMSNFLTRSNKKPMSLSAFKSKTGGGASVESGIGDMIGGVGAIVGGTASGVLAGVGLAIGTAKLMYGTVKSLASGVTSFLDSGRDRYHSEATASAVTGFSTKYGDGNIGVVNRVSSIGDNDRDDRGVFRRAIGNASDFNKLGYTSTEANNYMRELAVSRGYSGRAYYTNKQGQTVYSEKRESMEDEMTRLISLEKQYGVSSGFFAGLSKYQQFDHNVGRNAGRRETSYDIHRLHEIMKKSGGLGKEGDEDNSRMSEYAQTLSDRAFAGSRLNENINTDRIIDNMGLFHRIGGSFGDSRMAERMETVNNALVNPDNDYKQAFNFSVLRQLNPNASFVELQKMREKGLEQKGFLQTSLKNLRGLSGADNDTFEQLIHSRLGVSYSQAETLRKAYDSGRTRDEDYKFDEGYLDKENIGKVLEDGGKYVAPADVIRANMNDVLTTFSTAIQKGFSDEIKNFTQDFLDEWDKKHGEKDENYTILLKSLSNALLPLPSALVQLTASLTQLSNKL
jgi:hypothetical protein